MQHIYRWDKWKRNYPLEFGGAKKSQHLLGRAADIVVRNVSPDVVATYLEQQYPFAYGIGRYATFTHIDSRSQRRRW